MLEVISTFEELKNIESELNAFYDMFQVSHFLSPSYCINAYELFFNTDNSNSLYFIIKRDANNIVGYIPLYINAKGTLKFVYDKHTDFLSEEGNQFNFNDFKKIARGIDNYNIIKRIELDNLISESKLLHFFKHFFSKGCNVYSYNNHSFLFSYANEGLLKHLSSSDRSELKRILKKNNQFSFKVYTCNDVFPKKEIELLRLKMIQSKTRTNDFLSKNTLHLIESLYQKGEVELFSKSSIDALVSLSIVLKNNCGKRMVWIDLYDNIKYINLSAYIEYIEYLDLNSLKYLNFGRGSYDYKAQNFQPNCENLYNFRYSKSKWDFFFTNYYPLREFVKRILKS